MHLGQDRIYKNTLAQGQRENKAVIKTRKKMNKENDERKVRDKKLKKRKAELDAIA